MIETNYFQQQQSYHNVVATKLNLCVQSHHLTSFPHAQSQLSAGEQRLSGFQRLPSGLAALLSGPGGLPGLLLAPGPVPVSLRLPHFRRAGRPAGNRRPNLSLWHLGVIPRSFLHCGSTFGRAGTGLGGELPAGLSHGGGFSAFCSCLRTIRIRHQEKCKRI